MGGLILNITLPSWKYIAAEDFKVISGQCTVEEDTEGRGYGGWWFAIDNTEKEYSIGHRPELDSYGEMSPYYCEIIVTEDEVWEIGYKVYDLETTELLYSYSEEE